MPRNPANKRIEILLSPSQYEALLRAAEADGYIVLLPGVTTDAPDGAPATMDTRGSVAEFVRDHLAWTIPDFMAAAPLKPRGKYARKKATPADDDSWLPTDMEDDLPVEEIAAIEERVEAEMIADFAARYQVSLAQARQYFDLLPHWCSGELKQWPPELPKPECPD